MALCQYELDRLSNIARNQKHLRSLGLADDNKLCERTKRPKLQKDPGEQDLHPERQPERRSSRVAKQPPTHKLLDDDFFEEEERMIERPRRQPKPRRHYMTEQASEHNASARGMHSQDVSTEYRREEDDEMYPSGLANMDFQSLLNDDTVIIGNNGVPMYHTNGVKARCPHCLGYFVICRSGKLHKHACAPSMPILPSMG